MKGLVCPSSNIYLDIKGFFVTQMPFVKGHANNCLCHVI